LGFHPLRRISLNPAKGLWVQWVRLLFSIPKTKFFFNWIHIWNKTYLNIYIEWTAVNRRLWRLICLFSNRSLNIYLFRIADNIRSCQYFFSTTYIKNIKHRSDAAINALWLHSDIKQAIDHPRLHNQLSPNVTSYERNWPKVIWAYCSIIL
jgi:hypothetical protein